MNYTPLHFIELPVFSKYVLEHLTTEQYYALQDFLSLHPTSGDVIPGTRGCRKLRWIAEGRGKRGGTRVIYYFQAEDGTIYLMVIYAKNQETNYPTHLIRKLRDGLEDD